MLEINFRVWTSARPVGLKFTGPSAKLQITLIISNVFWTYAICYLQVNTWNCNQINLTIVFIYPYMVAKTRLVSYSMSFTGLTCFQVVCLEIIHSDPKGVLHVFLILEFSTKLAEDFIFLSIKPKPFQFIPMPPGTCLFWSKQVSQMLC